MNDNSYYSLLQESKKYSSTLGKNKDRSFKEKRSTINKINKKNDDDNNNNDEKISSLIKRIEKTESNIKKIELDIKKINRFCFIFFGMILTQPEWRKYVEKLEIDNKNKKEN